MLVEEAIFLSQEREGKTNTELTISFVLFCLKNRGVVGQEVTEADLVKAPYSLIEALWDAFYHGLAKPQEATTVEASEGNENPPTGSDFTGTSNDGTPVISVVTPLASAPSTLSSQPPVLSA